MNQFYITTLRILKFDPSIVIILNSLNFLTKCYPTNCRRYEIITVYSFKFCRKAYIQHTNVPDICKHRCTAIANTLIGRGLYGKFTIIYVI